MSDGPNGKGITKGERVPHRRVSGVESSLGTYFSLEREAPVNAEDFLLAWSQG